MRRANHGGMGGQDRAHARAPGMAVRMSWVGSVKGAGVLSEQQRKCDIARTSRARLGLRTAGDSDRSAALTRKGKTEGMGHVASLLWMQTGGACSDTCSGCGDGWCGPVVGHSGRPFLQDEVRWSGPRSRAREACRWPRREDRAVSVRAASACSSLIHPMVHFERRFCASVH
jgi:hypothetical protein